MSNQRYPEGYMVVVHSRAEAYPLQGWYERRRSTTLRHPTLEQGAGCTSPPRCAGGWVPRTAAIGGSGRGGEVVLIPHQGSACRSVRVCLGGVLVPASPDVGLPFINH